MHSHLRIICNNFVYPSVLKPTNHQYVRELFTDLQVLHHHSGTSSISEKMEKRMCPDENSNIYNTERSWKWPKCSRIKFPAVTSTGQIEANWKSMFLLQRTEMESKAMQKLHSPSSVQRMLDKNDQHLTIDKLDLLALSAALCSVFTVREWLGSIWWTKSLAVENNFEPMRHQIWLKLFCITQLNVLKGKIPQSRSDQTFLHLQPDSSCCSQQRTFSNRR